MMSERHAAPHQINYPVSQSYIYQTPLVHDSSASRAQSSIEDLVPQTHLDLLSIPWLGGYAPTDTQSAGKKNAFCTALERVVKEVPEHEQLFVLMDANARTRRGGGKLGSEECKVLGAYGRDTLNDNGERLLLFSANREFFQYR